MGSMHGECDFYDILLTSAFYLISSFLIVNGIYQLGGITTVAELRSRGQVCLPGTECLDKFFGNLQSYKWILIVCYIPQVLAQWLQLFSYASRGHCSDAHWLAVLDLFGNYTFRIVGTLNAVLFWIHNYNTNGRPDDFDMWLPDYNHHFHAIPDSHSR